MFNILRSFQTLFQSGWTILYPHQHCLKAQFCHILTITCYYLSFILAIRVEVTWHFTVVSLKCVLLTYSWFIVAVQLPSHVPLFATPWTAARQASLPSPYPGVCPSSCSLHQWCGPAISSPHTLFSSALNLSQCQGPFQWVICSHQMTKILELQLQHQSFQWIFRVDLL